MAYLAKLGDPSAGIAGRRDQAARGRRRPWRVWDRSGPHGRPVQDRSGSSSPCQAWTSRPVRGSRVQTACGRAAWAGVGRGGGVTTARAFLKGMKFMFVS